MILQMLNPDNYSLTRYALPVLGVGSAIAALGIFVLIRERMTHIGVTFWLFTLSVSTWLLANGAAYASIDEHQALWWIRVMQLGVVFIPTTIVVLTLEIIQKRRQFRILIRVSVLLSFLFTIGVYATDLHVPVLYHYAWGYYPRYGPLGFAFIGFFCIVMVVILLLYWREYRSSADDRRRRRLKGMLVSFCIGYLGAIDFLPALGVPLYAFGYIPMSFFLIGMAYVITRYRLVDITLESAAGQILETMQGAVIVVDLEGSIRVANRVAYEMLGYQKPELLGKDITAILDVPAATIDHVRAGERAASHEMTWTSRGGQRFEVSVSASLVAEARDNSPMGTVYVAHDITERKQAEERLRESLSLKRATLESTADGILVVNGQGKVVDFNSKFIELWGIPLDVMEQKDDDRLLRHVFSQLKDPESFVKKVRELYDNPDAEDFDEVQFKDGRIFERNSIPHRLEGKSVGRVWSFRDISERKRAEGRLKNYAEELRERNDDLKNFSYIVSHDLRTPLVNIKGFSSELASVVRDIQSMIGTQLDRFGVEDRQKLVAMLERDVPEAVHFIGWSVNQMDNLINAVLKLSRAGGRQLNPEPIEMQQFVQEIVHSLANQIEACKISVTVGDLPPVVGDRTALEQIFGNLLENAVKYLDPERHGSIEVTAERLDGETVFHVRDTGRGMAPEDIPKAFEVFRRVGKQDVPGEGIGLAHVKTLVRLLGGRIWCVSERGVGTVFSFTIPTTGSNIMI